LFAGADNDTVGDVVSGVTVKVNDVTLDRLPAVPVTVMVDVARGVDTPVTIVRVVVQVGVHEPGENEPEAPAGKPDAAKDTA
jgi:hypothetical protein